MTGVGEPIATPWQRRQVALEQLEVQVKHRFSELESLLSGELGPSVAATMEFEVDGMVAAIRARVLAEQLPPEKVERTETVEFEHPATWWEMFRDTYRDRWWMAWSVRRRPVRTLTRTRGVRLEVSLRRFRTYPRATVTIPELGTPVHVAFTEEKAVRW